MLRRHAKRIKLKLLTGSKPTYVLDNASSSLATRIYQSASFLEYPFSHRDIPCAQPTSKIMEEVPPTKTFKHKPLPDSTTHIRLLEIESVNADGQVVCLLTDWPVEKAPNYYALSYTWGSPTATHQILINGCAFTAGQNCVYALKQAHVSNASRYFWMDALCIDQKTIQEKSHQVGMMGQIYARSVHVLACVGPHTDDSTFLFQTIDKNRSLLASIHRLTFGPTVQNMRNWVMPNPIPKSSWVALRCLFAISPGQRWFLASDFAKFMKRSYFSRVWVLQELHLAPKISLCCGMDTRSFDYLLAVSMLVDFWINFGDYEDSLTSSISFVANIFSKLEWFSRRKESCLSLQEDLRHIQHQRGCLTLASGVRGRRRLAEVLEAMQNFQCTDVRDRLFGVLALVEWGRGKPVVPDYGKDSYQVAIEVLRVYLENPETEPISGMAVEWPRRLWKIFHVKIEEQPKAAMLKRKNGDGCWDLIYGDSHLRAMINSLLNDCKVYFQSPPTRYQNFRGHPRDTWYGVKLLDTKRVSGNVPSPRGLQPYYLSCEAKLLEHSPESQLPLVRIVDQDNRLFAYAPADTRPNDWLLISEAGSLSDKIPAMIVVKNTDRNYGIYSILGQASKSCEYDKIILPFLNWRYFGSHWYAEDLFLFDWMYVQRSVSTQSKKTAHSWLCIEACAYEGSSFFYGPITRITMDADTDISRNTTRYHDRRVPTSDLDMENPFLNSLLDSGEDYEYLLLIT